MKELRRRIGKTFEHYQKTFNAAMSPLSNEERNVFLDNYYSLPGVTDYIDKKSEEYDEASGESFSNFIDRNFNEYKAEYEKKNK